MAILVECYSGEVRMAIKTIFETWGRMIIAVVVLFVLGENLIDPSILTLVLIDGIMLIWIFLPAIKFIRETWILVKINQKKEVSF